MIINYNNINYNASEKYSFKNFTGQDLSLNNDMDALEIYNSCFSQEILDREVFPKDMMGTTFIKCNLSNCKIPDGNLLIDCNTTRFQVQNDLRDWIVDENNIPTKVMNEKREKQLGRSVNPLDIPIQKLKSLSEIKKAGV